MINEPAELIQEYPQLVEEFVPRDKQLVEQILAAKRITERSLGLPPRSRRAAYLVEPERVMYCVHSTPVFNSNGYSIRTRGVAQGIQNSAGEVFAVARPGYPWDTKADRSHPEKRRHQEDYDGVQYVHIPGPNLNTSPMDFYIQMAADAYVREARRLRPQLIHAASNHLTALPALIAARRLGVPFVYEVRGFWELTGVSNKPGWETSERYRLAVELETLVAAEADHVVAITNQVADELEIRGVDRKKISVAENAVDPKAILPLPKDVKYALSRRIRTDVPVIGFAGSVVTYEGLETLIEASALLDERGIDHQVVIAGSGSSAEALKAMRDEAKLKTVTFLGRIPNAEIPRLLSTYDIMPCPRTSEKVTELVSPLKPLEAFSASKAVVLSDVAPHVDLAGPEQERALLFKAGDAKELANVLQRLIQDKNLAQQLGRAGRLWTLDERNWAALGEKLASAYERAVEEYRIAQPATSKPLNDVKLGVIADEFTTSTLAGACEVVAIDRSNWQTQLDQDDFDAIFVESAWAGNSGTWYRGVGYYSAEESQDLYELLAHARTKGIPSIFWNKEDPVHIERFLKTASQFDHIFTTDANMIPRYLRAAGPDTKTVASLPFYAEPTLHNPLPSARPYEHTVAYAGTYYGNRYKQRSQQLRRLLQASEPYGLTIYDRQLQYKESPYQFPLEFRGHIKGALPYNEVLHQYKSHLAQLNVNSVVDSPTMYSRRVVEIAASGGIVMSGPGRGIDETLGNTILASDNESVWSAALHAWATKPESKLKEIWRQMRTIFRSHTTATALSIAFRSAGIPVDGLDLDNYAIRISNTSEETLQSIIKQSVLPSAVVASESGSDSLLAFKKHGIEVITENELDEINAVWVGTVDEELDRTHFEDLLSATMYGSWEAIYYQANSYDFAAPVAQPVEQAESFQLGLERIRPNRNAQDGSVLLQVAKPHLEIYPPNVPSKSEFMPNLSGSPRTVLFAGHDLKFARELMKHLEIQGYRILVDKWDDHNKHDVQESKNLLAQADIIFCEWGLGNALWYSRNASRQQRLVIRVHSQELRRDYLAQINHRNVDSYIFVGELVRRAAIESHNVPSAKTKVVANAVDVEKLALPKTPNAAFNIGLVGIVPRSKRLDLALDIIEQVRAQDSRYRLRIKGKQPYEYPWLTRISSEMAYYSEQYERIEQINSHVPGTVVFDPFGDDMEEWYQKIGSVLSVSDFESFHLTLADGAASGARPYSLLWPGADLIYPQEWLYTSPSDIADGIVQSSEYAGPTASSDFIQKHFNASLIHEELTSIILGPPTSQH
jgi:glycosyltransferase involved in cell wall biosynthesis